MTAANELLYPNLGIPQSKAQPNPPTIASAATIAPSHFLTFITGTVAVATITPPADGAHMLVFLFTTTTPAAFTTSGNISAVATPTQNIPCLMFYNPSTGKYTAKT
jgi:hypothetical protein